MFRRIAIVNRGEAAMRLIHAVRDLNALSTGGRAIETVALHTDGERARHVRPRGRPRVRPRARVGPALPRPRRPRARAARDRRRRRLGRLGLRRRGPGVRRALRPHRHHLRRPVAPTRCAGSATRSAPSCSPRRPASPSPPWSDGAGRRPRDGRAATPHRIGYPLMLKAAAGGGGRGIRVVTSDAELAAAFERTQRRGRSAPSATGVVFLERLVTGARHVEVQLIADGHGTAWALGVRDCSVQRRNQKVIEESASPVLDAEQEQLRQGRGGPAGRGRRLPQRRHRRVPLPARRAAVRVPRGQHPAAGRAPGHRADHRARPGQAAAARRRRRPARGRAAAAGRARGRGPAQRRGPRPRLRAGARPDRAAAPARRSRASASTPASARATSSRPTSTR